MDFLLEYAKLIKAVPKLCLPCDQCENSPYNSFLYKSKNCYLCFSSGFLNTCYYLDNSCNADNDCTDCDFLTNSELCYNCMSVDGCYNVNCSWWAVNCANCEYGFCNIGCNDCFGCVNVKRRQFCILNQQYSKEEYAEKVAEIKENLKKRGLYGKFLLMDAAELAKTME